jgi:hypothetical protein
MRPPPLQALKEDAARQPGDRWEAEANAVAARVLAGPAADAGGVRGATGRLLGRDFGGVRLHTGAQAAARAEAEGAHAVTSGSDVYFGAGRFRPELPLGRALIGHELAHVAQQGAAPRADPVGAHLRALEGGARPEPGGYRDSVDAFRAGHPAGELAAGRAALREPGAPEVTPAPAGVRQRCVAGCRSCNESEPQPKDAGTAEQQAATPANTAATAASGPGATGGGTVTDPNRVIRISWTFDDGPTGATGDMATAIGAIPGTWFVMRNQLGTGPAQKAALAELVKKQGAGSEIGIHAFHPTIAHHAWYPVTVAAAVPKAYPSVDDAMTGLADFVSLLKTAGVNVKFARFPGGEHTETVKYLQAEGAPDADQNARKILKGDPLPSDPAVTKVAGDWAKIQAKLKSLGMVIWGGSSSGALLRADSWEAEAEPPGSTLTNDAVPKFKKTVDAVDKESKPHSLVILAHDKEVANATAIKGYIKEMDDYAVSKKVKIEYYTMSGLFQAVRGAKP